MSLFARIKAWWVSLLEERRQRRVKAKADQLFQEWLTLNQRLAEAKARLERNQGLLPEPPDKEICWPPEDAPVSFGNFTTAKPRPGKPDLELARKVAALIHGLGDPTKRIALVSVSAVYEDSTSALLYERKGHCRVVLGNDADQPALFLELPREEPSFEYPEEKEA